MRFWTEAQIDRLHAMLRAGKTYDECAEAFGRTKGSIAGAADRYGRSVSPNSPRQYLGLQPMATRHLVDPHAPDEDNHAQHVRRVLKVKASGFPAFREVRI